MSKDKPLSFKVTVEFVCKNMATQKELENRFNNDPELCYKFISDNYNDSPSCFSSKEKVIKVEIINN